MLEIAPRYLVHGIVSLLLLAMVVQSCGNAGSGFNPQQTASEFKESLASLTDKRLKDTIVSSANDSIRVLLANYIIPQDSLREDIGFDQVEARLLVMKDDQELHRARIGIDWSREQLHRSDMNFSPLVDFKFEEASAAGLSFRCMLVEYDQNKMHRLSYVVDALGKVSCRTIEP